MGSGSMDGDRYVLGYIAKYKALGRDTVTWYTLRHIDQDESILRYGTPVKALRALAEKGYLEPVPGGPSGMQRYRLSPAGEAMLARSSPTDENGRSE